VGAWMDRQKWTRATETAGREAASNDRPNQQETEESIQKMTLELHGFYSTVFEKLIGLHLKCSTNPIVAGTHDLRVSESLPHLTICRSP
jgi:hypothetical protein